jgi:starch phosphorylase
VLHALGIQPTYWHANEGHTAFMMLERIRIAMEQHLSFDDALARVRSHTAFTTHTPVPAGHDVFPFRLMSEQMSGFWSSAGVEREAFLELGRPTGGGDEFNMTALALRTSDARNAVSAIHGHVSRRMWNPLWPGVAEEDVPIIHVTNGVHVPTWLAAEVAELYDLYLAPDWHSRHDDPLVWERVDRIPDDDLWRVRRRLKHRLITAMTMRAQECWASGRCTAEQALAMGGLFERDALTIGFVRRFTEYKRPDLLFYDIERLKRLLANDFQPIQVVFAGKSHPADEASKRLLQKTFRTALDHDFHGRIAFVEDYDMHMARLLTRGVDVWLNTPRRPREASGTSGMKASMNGVLHLSVPDGWWPEAYDGTNGWVIGDESVAESAAQEDSRDATALYQLLETKIVPLFYDRDRNGVPHGWLAYVKDAIRTVTPRFSARRMVKQYVEKMYAPVLDREPPL